MRVGAGRALGVICGCALLVAIAAAAQIERFRDLEPPDLLELTGHVGKPFRDEPGGWNLTLGVRLTPLVYRFHLARMRILNSGQLPDQVLFAVEPYDPNFQLFGSSEQLSVLAAATPQDVVTITGYRRSGSRVVMLTGITVAPAPTPPASPPR